MDEEQSRAKNLPPINKPEKKKCRFSDEIEKMETFDVFSREDDIFQGMDKSMDVDDIESLSECSSDPQDDDDDCFNFLDNGDIDRKLLRNLDRSDNYRLPKERFSSPNIDEGHIDSSVKHFVSEMSDFYNEMSSKLKSLKTCPVLENSSYHHLDPDDEKFMIEKKFNNLYKNLKKTPQMKKTLSIISKMDSDISETISKFKEQKAERLDIQQQLIRKMPVDRESQLFLQLCTFEANSNKSQQKIGTDERKNEKTGAKMKSSKTREQKNFVERNIELAKMGMNFPISDEQKQRLERLLRDNDGTSPQRQPSDAERGPSTSESNILNVDEDIYQNCTLNAYRLSDDHKGRLIEIDSALEEFNEDHPRKVSESNIGTDLVRSLKEIDEKLKAISTSYLRDQERLERIKKTPTDMNIDRIDEEVLDNNSNNNFSYTSIPKDM